MERKNKTLVILDCRVVTGTGIAEADIVVKGTSIHSIGKGLGKSLDPDLVIEANGLYAFPGLIDPHVHLRDPWQSYKEDFVSGTSAAVHGGVTTVFDMPNNTPFVDSDELIIKKKNSCSSGVYSNIGFYLGISESNKSTFIDSSQAIGFKLYTIDSTGVEPLIRRESLREMVIKYNNSLLMGKRKRPMYVHAEQVSGTASNLASHDSSRSEQLEAHATEEMIRYSKKLHVTHVSSPIAAELLKDSCMSFDVTPHHVLLGMEGLPDNSISKVNPPIRKDESRKFLSHFLEYEGCMLGSDHAPHSAEEKSRDFEKSLPGISSLDIELPLWITIFSRTFGLDQGLPMIARKNRKIAEMFGLQGMGSLELGFPADISLVDMSENPVDCSQWFSKAKLSPYDGMKVLGSVFATLVNGEIAFHSGKLGERKGRVF